MLVIDCFSISLGCEAGTESEAMWLKRKGFNVLGCLLLQDAATRDTRGLMAHGHAGGRWLTDYPKSKAAPEGAWTAQLLNTLSLLVVISGLGLFVPAVCFTQVVCSVLVLKGRRWKIGVILAHHIFGFIAAFFLKGNSCVCKMKLLVENCLTSCIPYMLEKFLNLW
jgi:hypothetical protein